MRSALVGLILATMASGAVVLDRIAVVVGQHVVKLSDVERDLRMTEFLNREPLDMSAAAKRKAADRLVDQEIIREELATAGYPRATDADSAAMLDQIRTSRFGNAEARLVQSLRQYGLTEEQLRAQLLWQLTVLRFIDQRFRTGVFASDQEIRAYYDSHAALHNASFEAAAPQIKSTIEGERVNQQFEEWIAEQRKRIRVEYREGAFQ